ncbi:hypothetical protein A0H81_00659 [Grifola frondosa]|uniref:Uncharacterized protein n=1 Tax=Grifola frondosa TaxID=5627 RepID=A0A1C7MSQ7_GRIFR|nr:hypothetical protein A0H81_00659 [Grifola frondosa]
MSHCAKSHKEAVENAKIPHGNDNAGNVLFVESEEIGSCGEIFTAAIGRKLSVYKANISYRRLAIPVRDDIFAARQDHFCRR